MALYVTVPPFEDLEIPIDLWIPMDPYGSMAVFEGTFRSQKKIIAHASEGTAGIHRDGCRECPLATTQLGC